MEILKTLMKHQGADYTIESQDLDSVIVALTAYNNMQTEITDVIKNSMIEDEYKLTKIQQITGAWKNI